MSSNKTATIEVQYAIAEDGLPSEESLTQWAQAALNNIADSTGEITLRLVSTEEIQTLNHSYRGKDSPTNVLSFPFEMPEGLPLAAQDLILGDIALCADVIAEESQTQNKPLSHHWAHMVIHGVLHLLGFDHIGDSDAAIMEQLEIDILATMGIPNPYLIATEQEH